MMARTRRSLDRYLVSNPLPIRLRQLLTAVVEGERDAELALTVGGRDRLAQLERQFFGDTGTTVYDAALSIHVASLRPPPPPRA